MPSLGCRNKRCKTVSQLWEEYHKLFNSENLILKDDFNLLSSLSTTVNGFKIQKQPLDPVNEYPARPHKCSRTCKIRKVTFSIAHLHQLKQDKDKVISLGNHASNSLLMQSHAM
jgi:hypothetical protein